MHVQAHKPAPKFLPMASWPQVIGLDDVEAILGLRPFAVVNGEMRNIGGRQQLCAAARSSAVCLRCACAACYACPRPTPYKPAPAVRRPLPRQGCSCCGRHGGRQGGQGKRGRHAGKHAGGQDAKDEGREEPQGCC